MVELKLSNEHMQVLSMALQDMPYKLSAPVINSINEQIKLQFELKNTTSLDEAKKISANK